MSCFETEEAGLLVEEASCERWGLEHCANNGNDPQFYDAVTTEETIVTGVNDDRPVDAKGCARWVSDGSKRRRGRWWFSRSNHEKLVFCGGQYALGVYDEVSGDVLRVAIVDASTIGPKLTWTPAGERHHSEKQAQLRWANVFHSGLGEDDVDVAAESSPAAVEGGGDV